MVRSLEKLCLEMVCRNLKFYYIFCTKKNIKIPHKIGNKIWKYIINYDIKVNDDDVQIFNHKIMDITHFSNDRKRSKSSSFNFFDFLNNHQLDYCSLERVCFNLKSDNFHLTVKNMRIVSTVFFTDSNVEENRNFYRNCLNVENLIVFAFLNFETDFDFQYNILVNSFEKLQELSIAACKFNQKSLTNFFSKLFLLKNLYIFIFQYNTISDLNLKNIKVKFREDQRDFGKKLKKLHVPLYFLYVNDLMCKNFISLQSLTISDENFDVNFARKIYKNFSQIQLETIRKLDLKLNNMMINDYLDRKFVKILTKIKNLTKIKLDIKTISRISIIKILKWLKKSSNTLQTFQLSKNFKELEKEIFFQEFFANLTVLEEISVNGFSKFLINKYLTSFPKFFHNCRKSLKIVSFHINFYEEDDYNNLKAIFEGISQCTNLKEFNVKNSFPEFNPDVTDILKKQKNSLTKLQIDGDCNNLKDEIYSAISNCIHLKEITVIYIVENLRKIFTDWFYEKNCLQVLIFQGSVPDKIPEFEYFIEILSKLKHLRVMHFYLKFRLSLSNLRKFCCKLNSLSLKIQEFPSMSIITDDKYYMLKYNSEKERFFYKESNYKYF